MLSFIDIEPPPFDEDMYNMDTVSHYSNMDIIESI